MFPRGTVVSAIATYYDTFLTANGWTNGIDYKIVGNAIHFYGISKLDGGSNHQHLAVNGTTDSDKIKYETEKPKKRKLMVTRGASLAGGNIQLAGFGFAVDGNGNVQTATTPLEACFEEGASAGDIIGSLASELAENGWAFSTTANANELIIYENGEGMPIHSLFFEIVYLDIGPDQTDDHWAFEWIEN